MWWLEQHVFHVILGVCISMTVIPLWLVHHLPAVDVPQHVFLVQVLSSLHDAELPYQDIYSAKPGLTYLAFYYPARAIAALFGAEQAIRIWLTMMLAGMPIGLAVLLRALGRSPWPALLSCLLVFSDNFYWGFISFQSTIPFVLLSIAFFVRTLEEPLQSPRYPWLLGASGAALLLVQLTHGAAMIFPALALPLMLLVTPSDWPRRLRSVAALLPGVVVFLAWIFGGVGTHREQGALGEPWKAHGSLFQRENFVFHPIDNKPKWFVELLSNGFRANDVELHHLYGLAAAAALAVVLWLVRRDRPAPGWRRRSRPWVLCALGAACFLFLPAEIHGYMSPIDSRYAQVAALLAVTLVPMPAGRLKYLFSAAAVVLVGWTATNLSSLFRDFDREASSFEAIVKDLPRGARIMHLVLDTGSAVVTHPVYLHYAALAAARVEGVPSFSLAIDAAFPVGYQPGKKPPASPWEWRPAEFDWQRDGKWYDYYVVRGYFSPATLFRGHDAEVQKMRSVAGWTLMRRVP